MPTSFFVIFSLTHWMDTLSSTYFQFVVLFFLANDGAMTFLVRFIPLPAKLQSAFPHSRHRSSFSGHCILIFNIFGVTPLHISIIGIFQISHRISIFRPTEMGGQVKQHVNFLQVCKFS